jgi:hypothetical protein
MDKSHFIVSFGKTDYGPLENAARGSKGWA